MAKKPKNLKPYNPDPPLELSEVRVLKPDGETYYSVSDFEMQLANFHGALDSAHNQAPNYNRRPWKLDRGWKILVYATAL